MVIRAGDGTDWDGAGATTELGPLARPWPRYWAKSLDLILIGGALFGVLGLAGLVTAADPRMDRLLGLLAIPVVLALEAIILALTGQTPGKALAGIRVIRAAGGKPALGTALLRALRLWLFGLALGLPLLSLGTLIYNFVKLRKGRLTSWDAREETRVIATASSLKRTIVTAIVALALMAGLIVLSLPDAREVGASDVAVVDSTAPAEQFAATLAELNRGLPRQIDETTRLDRVRLEGDIVYFDQVLVDAAGKVLAQADAAELAPNIKAIEEVMRTSVCQRQTGDLVRSGMTLVYLYSGDAGLVGDVKVKPGDCA